ncbi:hypothetical protein KGF54_002864 [Candida jiufengensis]|uniref:uncharacterized protein n=1 Tax=Candida jiufengensis TaxID=497108 RepID=UPI0022253446|nr:uncharacterized protein KGF54_002864 [Candida jiufengensis]KAI5953492.1 hypothetical protein KGF54_002864 [Candida jiufengensis]
MRDITNSQNSSHNNHKLQISNDIPRSNTAKAQYVTSPIGKVYTTREYQDPLQELLIESRQKLSNLKVSLPEKNLSPIKSIPKTPPSNKFKTNFLIFEDDNGGVKDRDNTNRESNSIFNDNIIDEIPPLQSTPTKFKQSKIGAQLLSTPPSLKSSKIQKLPIRKKQQKKIEFSTHNDQHEFQKEEQEEDDEDELACHANHILKMAIDSTMFNSMNSSLTLQNITVNNNNCNDSLNDEFRKQLKHKVFDINDEEIRAAVNG